MEKLKLGLALTGSYCSFSKLFAVLDDLCGEFDVVPILSENACRDSRFGPAEDWRRALEAALSLSWAKAGVFRQNSTMTTANSRV